MVSLYFGLPGCGKTTLMCKLAKQGRKHYKNIYCNVHINLPYVRYVSNEQIGHYMISDGLLLIDEATLFADNRDYKNFGHAEIKYFLEHRHFHIDIALFTQQWDGVDRKIRVITDRVFYIYKTRLFGKWFSRYYRVPYGIIIPDAKGKTSGEHLGEIIQGYSKPPMIIRIFCRRFFRPRYYKFFDSFERYYLPPLPDCTVRNVGRR